MSILQKMYRSKFFNLAIVLSTLVYLTGIILIMVYSAWSSNPNSNITADMSTYSTVSAIAGSFIIAGAGLGLLISIFYIVSIVVLIFNLRSKKRAWISLVLSIVAFVFWFVVSVLGLFAVSNGNFYAEGFNPLTATGIPSIFGGSKILPAVNSDNWQAYFISIIAILVSSLGMFFITRKTVLNLKSRDEKPNKTSQTTDQK